jgi:hypothetical protein
LIVSLYLVFSTIFSVLSLPVVNIRAAPAYGVNTSQLIRYSRACGYYQDFLDRGFVLTPKLLNQGGIFGISTGAISSTFPGCGMFNITVASYQMDGTSPFFQISLRRS